MSEENLEISPLDAQKELEAGIAILIDVRDPLEFQMSRIEGATLVPLKELHNRYKEIDKSKHVIVHCHHGIRSLLAAQFLYAKGFRVKSMQGGIHAWSQTVDSSVPVY